MLEGQLKPLLFDCLVVCPTLPGDLEEWVLNQAPAYKNPLQYTAERIPESRLRSLLNHADPEVAGYAAVGEWRCGENPKSVRDALKGDWRRAILTFRPSEEYVLADILASDQLLAYEWMRARFEDGTPLGLSEAEWLAKLSNGLTREQRKDLIFKLPQEYFSRGLLLDLVGNDLDLCREIIESPEKEDLHLRLAECRDVASWERRAQILLDAGYSVQEIAENTRPRSWTWIGPESQMWAAELEKYKVLEQHPNEQVREVGKIIMTGIKRSIERALREERREAIYGRG